MRHLKRVVAMCLAVLLMVQTTGCTSWNAVTQPLPAAVARHPNRKVQVVLHDDRTINADSAKAGADALVTYQRAGVDTIPLGQIKSVKVRQVNPLKTVGLVLGIAAGAFAVLIVVFLISCPPSTCEIG